ncbi:DUF2850 domain-containing protein [Vibrio sp.]|nr:DUF2850 domain-containing protein [Vibrio sp.]
MSLISKVLIILAMMFASGLFSYLIMYSFSHLDRSHFKQVEGEWLEIDAPPYNQDVLAIREDGIYKNGKLLTSQYTVGRHQIRFETLNGVFIYEKAGTRNAPKLKRVQPEFPKQRFIQKGFEHTLDVKQRTESASAALADHFKQ